TLTLPAAPSPVWNVGDQIKVDGAGPAAYNGLYNLTAADNTNFIYTYSLASALPSGTARVNATNHGLQTGDLVTVAGAATSTFNVTDAVVDRRDANTFRYPAPGVSGTNGPISTATCPTTCVTGKKLVTALTAPGGVASVATAVIPSHGYGSAGATVSLTFSGATPPESNNGGSAPVATVVDANSANYTATNSPSRTSHPARATP